VSSDTETREVKIIELMTLTDTHCHLDFYKFDSDRQTVLERAIQAGVGRILIPGLSLTSSLSAVKLAHSHSILYAAIGVHPTEASGFEPSILNDLRNLAQHPKVKAIGEIGLDYYWAASPRDQQKKALIDQLALAAELQLPVVIHIREEGDNSTGDCASDLINILEKWNSGLKRDSSPLAERPGVLHSFSGTLETAQEAMRLGFFVGVSGPVTYKNGQSRQELVAALPLDHLLIETDAPFQTPHPHRGKRNEPAYVRLIADKIAFVRSNTTELVVLETTKNAQRLFAWE
jgi:TatD DNase family protein